MLQLVAIVRYIFVQPDQNQTQPDQIQTRLPSERLFQHFKALNRNLRHTP